jgi:hypothetical protein
MAMLCLIVLTVLVYLLFMVLFLGVLSLGTSDITRDSLWKLVTYWVIFMLPQLPAVWLGVTLTNLFIGTYNRGFAFYVYIGLLMLCVAVYGLFLLIPITATGMALVLLQAVTTVAVWWLVRRAFGRRKIAPV